MAKTDTTKTRKKTEAAGKAREFTEKSTDQAKVVYGQFKDAAEDAATMFDEQTTVFKDAATDLHLTAVDFAQKNANAGFDFARKLFAARDLGEVVTLQADFTREQGKAFAAQTRELGEITMKIGEQASRPFREGLARSTEPFKTVFPL